MAYCKWALCPVYLFGNPEGRIPWPYHLDEGQCCDEQGVVDSLGVVVLLVGGLCREQQPEPAVLAGDRPIHCNVIPLSSRQVLAVLQRAV